MPEATETAPEMKSEPAPFKVELHPVKEVPANAVVKVGRAAAPTQFDNAGLKAEGIYGFEVPSSAVEDQIVKELRRWADKQTPRLGLRVVGREPTMAMGEEKRKVYVQPYLPKKKEVTAK